MEFHIINLTFFLFLAPIIFFGFSFLSRLNSDKERNRLKILIALPVLLFVVRLFLVFYANTIGIMPYLIEDIVFYMLLMVFGLAFTWFYVVRIDKSSFKELGWEVKNVKKSVLYGLIFHIPLFLLMPLIVTLTSIQISINITIGKILVAVAFTVLGAFYEEIMFRGVIQNHLAKITDNNQKKIVVYTALTFTLTHLFYLPFDGFGIYYIFVFIMAILLSILRIKTDQLACAILHGGIVFLLIVLV